METALYNYLRAYAGLAALVGNRIYPLLLPQSPAWPAVTYQLISSVRDYVMDGTSIKRVVMQIDCWATSYAAVKAISGQIKNALDRFSGSMGDVEIIGTWLENETDYYEPKIPIFRVSLDIRFEHK